MILADDTLTMMGYHPDELPNRSGKYVMWKCEICGKVERRRKLDAHVKYHTACWGKAFRRKLNFRTDKEMGTVAEMPYESNTKRSRIIIINDKGKEKVLHDSITRVAPDHGAPSCAFCGKRPADMGSDMCVICNDKVASFKKRRGEYAG